MTKNKMILVLSSMLIALTHSEAGASELIWLQNTATVKLDANWAIFSEIQPRWWNDFKSTQGVVLRAGGLYRVNPEFQVGFGLGHMPQFLPVVRNENRLFQQLDWNVWKRAPLEFASRSRLEERFLENTDGISWRFREKVAIFWMPSRFGLYLWEELFLNLNSAQNQVNAGFDQNRLSIGVRYREELVTVEFGYLLQTLQSFQRQIQSNPGAVLAFSLNW